jgi:hypothetical protein
MCTVHRTQYFHRFLMGENNRKICRCLGAMNRVKLTHLPFQNMFKKEIDRVNGCVDRRG